MVALVGVTAFHQHLAPSRIFGRVSTAMARFIQDVRSTYDMPAGLHSLGIYSDELRTGIKRKAQTHTSHNMPRSQYEIYHFASKYDLPEAAV